MEFYGVLGEKLPHTISPMINNKIFSLLGIEAAYKKFEVEKKDLEKFIEGLKVLKIKGTNVTIPYKEEVIKYLDYVSPQAEKIKAVNTILLKDNKLYGYNTDYYGFESILIKNNIKTKGETAMVLGSGGASKAVITLLLDKEIKKIYLISRNKKVNPEYQDSRVEYMTYSEIDDIKGSILINTTPLGMHPKVDVSVVDETIIKNFDTLIDLIYNPKETKFLKIGKKLNKKACGGLEMLIGQAIKSEEIWNDISISDKITNQVNLYIDKHFK